MDILVNIFVAFVAMIENLIDESPRFIGTIGIIGCLILIGFIVRGARKKCGDKMIRFIVVPICYIVEIVIIVVALWVIASFVTMMINGLHPCDFRSIGNFVEYIKNGL